MASCDFAKYKTAGEAKAMFRHCEEEVRERDSHANQDIDVNRTSLNMAFGYFRDGYEAVCKAYDDRIKDLDSKPNANKRKDRVTLVGINIPAPEGMDEATSREWFTKAYEVLTNTYGENLLGSAVHFDEVHEYVDSETGKTRMSRPHMHVYVIPSVDEKLNAKQVTSRRNMISLNNSIHTMTETDFKGYSFMNGTKRKSRKSVEELKQESDKAKIEVEARREASKIIEEADVYALKVRRKADKDARERSEAILDDSRRKAKEIMDEAEKTLKRANTALEQVLRDLQRTEEDAPPESLIAYAQRLTMTSGLTVYDNWLKREAGKKEKRDVKTRQLQQWADDIARQYDDLHQQRDDFSL